MNYSENVKFNRLSESFQRNYRLTHLYSQYLNYFPEAMGRKRFYHPVERGFEREIAKRLAYWDKLRETLSAKEQPDGRILPEADAAKP